MTGFDEESLVVELAGLPNRAQVAFAVAAATRQVSSHERFARGVGINEQRPREIAMKLWSAVQSESIDPSGWAPILDEVMDLLPEEDEGDDWVSRALADDAISSLAYAIRCMSTSNPQEAAWAARRTYEAADQAAICALGNRSDPNSDASIKSHEWVQRELSRQLRDLKLLINGRDTAIGELKTHAFAESLLTESEALSISVSSS